MEKYRSPVVTLGWLSGPLVSITDVWIQTVGVEVFKGVIGQNGELFRSGECKACSCFWSCITE